MITLARCVAVLVVLGVISIVGGVTLLAGPGWAAITFGILAVAAAILLYEPKTGAKHR